MEQNKVKKYILYAIGEVLLVVIGILIALQVNNWNEQKKLNTKFQSTIEKVYNDLLFEQTIIAFRQQYMERQISMIDTLLNMPDHYPLEELPGRLMFVDLPRTPSGLASQNAQFNMSLLNYAELNEEQSDLAKLIYNYGFTASNQFNVSAEVLNSPVVDLLHANNIPTPPLSTTLNDYVREDYQAYFNRAHLDRTYNLLNSEELRTILTDQMAWRRGAIPALANVRSQNISLREAIRDYYPGVRFNYQDIGVVGSAVSVGWDPANKLPLNPVPENGFVFEGIFSFKDGAIKIVADDNWVVNWGATPAFDGSMVTLGQDIPVNPGTYKVIVNFDDNSYSITPVE